MKKEKGNIILKKICASHDNYHPETINFHQIISLIKKLNIPSSFPLIFPLGSDRSFLKEGSVTHTIENARSCQEAFFSSKLSLTFLFLFLIGGFESASFLFLSSIVFASASEFDILFSLSGTSLDEPSRESSTSLASSLLDS